MPCPFPVGVLDLGAQDVRGTLALAAAAATLGFGRFWITEHHDEGAPHANPTLLAALVAQATPTIRVGPSGVLLRYRTALAVAHDATLLEALFPGRIDFGVASARAPSPQAAALGGALADDDDALAARTLDLLAILRWETALVPLPATDGPAAPPPLWLSGNSAARARFAAAAGTGFASSSFHTSVPVCPDVFARYRDEFAPRPELPAPVTALAVSVLCAESVAEVRRYDDEYQRLFGYEQSIVGTAAQCAEQLLALQHATGADELVLAPRQHTAAEATRGLRALAAALAVAAPPSPLRVSPAA